MSFTAAIDISTFIWCEQDFRANKNQYYTLRSIAPNIYTQIKNLKLPVLLRNELYESIINEFPYIMVQEVGYEFQRLTLEFLTDSFLNWTTYADSNDNSITSVPVVVKQHFSNVVKTETQNQIVHLYQNGKNPEHKFIAYNYFLNHNNNILVLNQNQNTVEINALYYNSEQDIQDYFEQFRIKFEHNPKHTNQVRFANGEKISPFTCYHKENGQVNAQKLLEDAFQHQEDFYNFDIENNVYVKFVLTNGFTYHGYDLSDDNNNVPNVVKNYYNKNGRTF